jgi:hypothetical protein
MEFRQTGCIPPPQQQHFKSTQFLFRLICSLTPRSRFTAVEKFNYWALKLVTSVKCSSVTDFIAHYQYRVISNEPKQPVTDRALIGNGIYKPVTDRFNICNGLF